MPRQNPPDRSVQELYRDDPERADALVWGRRGALQGAALAAMGAALGAAIPFGRNMPSGLVPAALAQRKRPSICWMIRSRQPTSSSSAIMAQRQTRWPIRAPGKSALTEK